LERFLDLVFGNPFSTPTRDEYAMFLAFASSVRSASLARQVGAVIVSKTGEVLGIGTNDVPSAHGGLYWPGDHDHRDHVLGYDSNDAAKTRILEEMVPRLVVWARAQAEQGAAFQLEKFLEGIDKQIEGLTDRAALIDHAATLLEDASIMDITEYGRAVHAEMEAILSCARSGQSTRDATLYCTTFPCHNCAKHIIDAGICRVVYVQPYPKSKAEDLHGDAILFKGGSVKPSSDIRKAVRFEPFDGVGPRRFFDLSR
jgi:deoxycytidylate deaminase